MAPPFFPISADGLRGEWSFHALEDGRFDVEGFSVLAREIPHPGGRRSGSASLTGDGASPICPTTARIALGCGPDGWGPYHEAAMELAEGVDILLHDAQFTAAELASRPYFGHSAADYAVGSAARAGVGRVLLFHHDPNAHRRLGRRASWRHRPTPRSRRCRPRGRDDLLVTRVVVHVANDNPNGRPALREAAALALIVTVALGAVSNVLFLAAFNSGGTGSPIRRCSSPAGRGQASCSAGRRSPTSSAITFQPRSSLSRSGSHSGRVDRCWRASPRWRGSATCWQAPSVRPCSLPPGRRSRRSTSSRAPTRQPSRSSSPSSSTWSFGASGSS